MDFLAALALLSMGVFASMTFFRTEVREVRNTHERFAAALLAESEIERLRALPYDQIPIGEKQALKLTLPAAARVKGAAALLTVTESEPGLKTATVEITWRSPKDRPLRVEMSSSFAAEGSR